MVDLPQPLGPINTVVRPGATVRSVGCRACVASYVLETPFRTRMKNPGENKMWMKAYLSTAFCLLPGWNFEPEYEIRKMYHDEKTMKNGLKASELFGNLIRQV